MSPRMAPALVVAVVSLALASPAALAGPVGGGIKLDGPDCITLHFGPPPSVGMGRCEEEVSNMTGLEIPPEEERQSQAAQAWEDCVLVDVGPPPDVIVGTCHEALLGLVGFALP